MNKSILKVWLLHQFAGLSLGWFFHGLISHLWTGEHPGNGGYLLNTEQYIMHSVSMTGCVLIYFYFLQTCCRRLFQLSIMKYMIYFLTLPILVFWIGFILKAVPLDVLFWVVTVGLLNGYILTKELKLKGRKWVYCSSISPLVGFVVAALVLFPLDTYISKANPLLAHILLFTILGVIIGFSKSIIEGVVLEKIISEKNSN